MHLKTLNSKGLLLDIVPIVVNLPCLKIRLIRKNLFFEVDHGILLDILHLDNFHIIAVLGKIKEVFLYDGDTSVGLGFSEAGTRKGFKLVNSSRTLVIKCFKVFHTLFM